MEDPNPMQERPELKGLHRMEPRTVDLVTAEYLRRIGDARRLGEVTQASRRQVLAEVVEDFVLMRALVGSGVEVEGLTPGWADTGLTLRKV